MPRHLLAAVLIGTITVACGGGDAETGESSTTEEQSTTTVTESSTTSTVQESTTTTEQSTTTDEATTTERSTTTEQSTTTKGMSQSMEVYFAVEGGFANQIRSLSIAADGAATAEVSGRSSQGEVEPAILRTIISELDGSGLFDQDRTYEATGGADLQRYEIRYDGATVVAFDTTVPAELTEVIRLLDETLRAV